MGPRNIFRAGGLRPSWSYSTAGTLWRVVPAPPGIVVGEERDTKSRIASFFALDLTTGRVRWSGRRFHDDWWVGLAAVHRDVLLLHGFATPNMPGHRGIVAADVTTGKILWSDPASSLVDLCDDGLILSCETIHGYDLEERALRSGARRARAASGDLPARPVVDADSREIRSPQLLHSAGETDPRMENLLQQVSDRESLVWPVEFIDHPHALVIVTHERQHPSSNPPRFQAHLRVFERSSGSLLYEKVVQRGVHAPVPNTFSIVRDMLLVIKDGRSLVAIPL
jgi:hypothetical protein